MYLRIFMVLLGISFSSLVVAANEKQKVAQAQVKTQPAKATTAPTPAQAMPPLSTAVREVEFMPFGDGTHPAYSHVFLVSASVRDMMNHFKKAKYYFYDSETFQKQWAEIRSAEDLRVVENPNTRATTPLNTWSDSTPLSSLPHVETRPDSHQNCPLIPITRIVLTPQALANVKPPKTLPLTRPRKHYSPMTACDPSHSYLT